MRDENYNEILAVGTMKKIPLFKKGLTMRIVKFILLWILAVFIMDLLYFLLPSNRLFENITNPLLFFFLSYLKTGLILGIIGSLFIRLTGVRSRNWLISSTVGAIIGAFLVAINNSNQLYSVYTYVLGTTTSITDDINAISTFLFYISIGVLQWLVIRRKSRITFLWVVILIACKYLGDYLNPNIIRIIFVGGIQGITLAVLLLRNPNNKINIPTLRE